MRTDCPDERFIALNCRIRSNAIEFACPACPLAIEDELLDEGRCILGRKLVWRAGD